MKGGLCIGLYKASRKMYKNHVPVFPGLLMRLNRVLCSCDIPYTAEIGEDTVFNHNGLGCVIHERAIIGEKCLIQQNVTIGGKKQSGVPIIGDNVFIGAGACLIGGFTVGEHAQIGANAVVLCDVPPYATAVGVPARIILKKDA